MSASLNTSVCAQFRSVPRLGPFCANEKILSGSMAKNNGFFEFKPGMGTCRIFSALLVKLHGNCENLPFRNAYLAD